MHNYIHDMHDVRVRGVFEMSSFISVWKDDGNIKICTYVGVTYACRRITLVKCCDVLLQCMLQCPLVSAIGKITTI